MLLVFTLGACVGKSSNNPIQYGVTSEVDSLVTEQIEEDIVSAVNHYPEVGQLEEKPLLFTGNLILGEPVDTERGWGGLFYVGDKAYLDATRISVKTEDELVYEISTVHIDSALMLFSGLDVKAGNVDWVRIPNMPYFSLNVGEEFVFSLCDKSYALFAEGVPQENDLPTDYKLFLKNEKTKDLLVSIPSFDGSGSVSEILFVGDIDRDQKPDLIVNTSSRYNVYRPTIYLSSKAEKGHWVKPMYYADFTD